MYKAIKIRYREQVQDWQWRPAISATQRQQKLLFTDFPVLSWTGKHMKNAKLNSSLPFKCKRGRGWLSHYVHVQANILYIAVNRLLRELFLLLTWQSHALSYR